MTEDNVGVNLESDHIKVSMSGAVLTISLNRPERMNSICRPLARDLLSALQFSDSRDEVRAVVLRAEGKAFCAGQDLKEAIEFDSAGPIVEDVYNPIVRQLLYGLKPTICAVQGVAAGAGANLALLCDFVLAAEEATFSQAFSKIGLVPDTGGSFLLPRLVGLQKAKQLCLLGDSVPAQEAKEMGLVFSVHAAAELDGAARELAQRFADGATLAYGLTKKMLLESFSNSLDDQLNVEAEFQERASQSKDFKEGVSAFIEKRKPKFIGR